MFPLQLCLWSTLLASNLSQPITPQSSLAPYCKLSWFMKFSGRLVLIGLCCVPFKLLCRHQTSITILLVLQCLGVSLSGLTCFSSLCVATITMLPVFLDPLLPCWADLTLWIYFFRTVIAFLLYVFPSLGDNCHLLQNLLSYMLEGTDIQKKKF